MAQNEKIEEKDKEILKSLLEDGRKTFTDIGDEVNLSYATVSLRVKNMKEKGLIKRISPKINWSKVELRPSLIFIQVSPGSLEEIKAHLGDDPRCIFLATITGEYDLIVYCLFNDREGLSNFVQGLHTSELVQRTVTNQILNIGKDSTPPELLDLL